MKYNIRFKFTTATAKGLFTGKVGELTMETEQEPEEWNMGEIAEDIKLEIQKKYKRSVVVMVTIDQIDKYENNR
jgi:hypothetical protein